MPCVRRILPLAVVTLLAACSGNLGGGQSTLPGMPQNGNGTTSTQGYAAPTPTASPVSASNVATIGDSVAAQPLPEVMGFSGSIAFAKPVPAPSPSPNSKATAAAPGATAAAPGAPAAASVSIGVSAAVVDPPEAPHFGANAKGKRAEAGSPVGVLFISLLSTADVTLGEYPKIAIEVPREIAAKFHGRDFKLALFDPALKTKSYKLAIADRDLSSPAPGSMPVATAMPTVEPTIAPSSSPPSGFAPFTPPPVGAGLAASALPAEHVAFLATAATLTLQANRPVIFALYAAPASPSPVPSPSASAGAGHASPVAAPNASPSPLPSSTASPAAVTSPQPVPTSSVST